MPQFDFALRHSVVGNRRIRIECPHVLAECGGLVIWRNGDVLDSDVPVRILVPLFPRLESLDLVHRVEPLQIGGGAVQRDLGLAILLGALGKRDRHQPGIFGIFRRPDHKVRHAVRTGVDDHVDQLPRCSISATDRCSKLELHLLAA